MYCNTYIYTFYKPCTGQCAGGAGGAPLHYRDGRGLDTDQVLYYPVLGHLQSETIIVFMDFKRADKEIEL